MAEDDIVEQHHRLHGHELEQMPRDSKVQGVWSAAGPWGHTVRYQQRLTGTLLLLCVCVSVTELETIEIARQRKVKLKIDLNV